MPKQAKSYAPRIDSSTWERHRCRIKTLFVDQNETLSQVMESMRSYGLHAGESQYERQLRLWGIRKNRTREEWCLVSRVVEQRRCQGKDSTVFIRGIEQPSKRINRELPRSHSRRTGVAHSLPGFIRVLSPPATASIIEKPLYRQTATFYTFTLTVLFQSVPSGGVVLLGTMSINDGLDNVATVTSGLKLWRNESSFYLESVPWVEDGFSRIFEKQFLESFRVKRNRELLLEGRSHSLSQSLSESWSVPCWESVGVTPEEWESCGWNIFFGSSL